MDRDMGLETNMHDSIPTDFNLPLTWRVVDQGGVEGC